MLWFIIAGPMCVWAVYYIQIRKSEQRPPLHLRAADLVPQPRTAALRHRVAAVAARGHARTPCPRLVRAGVLLNRVHRLCEVTVLVYYIVVPHCNYA